MSAMRPTHTIRPFFFSSRRRHTSSKRDWSSDVCSSDLPQELVSMIVSKAVSMAQMMDIPVLGLVENMSYVECPDCGKKIQLYGESHVDEVAEIGRASCRERVESGVGAVARRRR